jgi:predicted nucleic acid-binding protein
MNVYADTSVLIAWFHADDLFAKQVTPWVQKNVTDFIWNSVLRAEVRHNLRQLDTSYARAAWNALRATEVSGRLNIGREKLSQLIDAADDLSAEKATMIPAGTWDYFHVAAALAAEADCFATCDQLQGDLAKASGGFREVKLFKG